ncbi:hypothetical protein [Pseudomonas phage vB_PsaM_M1]|nr:hypothetical protein [Pseudomonas phage vB_PsaM_M1]
MSKQYDYKTAKQMIQMRSDLIATASLGMSEDWFWTAEEVFTDGKFTLDLDEQPKIAGIKGSSWATPTIHLLYKDDREEMLDCFTGDSDSEKPAWFDLGVLSSPCQEWVEQVKRPKLT